MLSAPPEAENEQSSGAEPYSMVILLEQLHGMNHQRLNTIFERQYVRMPSECLLTGSGSQGGR